MAEAPRSWREVRVGAAVVLALAAVLLAFWVQRGRNPFAEAYFLVFFVADARGLQEGAPVLLSGLPVGEVQRIDVLGAGTPARGRYPDALEGVDIRVVLEVADRYREEITDRSRVRISTRGMSGARYVRIEKGPVGGRPLASGERIRTAAPLDLEQFVTRGAEVLERIQSLNRHAAQVGAKFTAGGGSLGRFMADPADNEAAENFEEMNLRAARVLRSLDAGEGTVALERRTRRIRTNLEGLQQSLKAIRRRALAGSGTLAGFASDTAFTAALSRLEARVVAMERKLDRGEGSLARLVEDPELLHQLEQLSAAIDSLTAQVKRDPLGSVDLRVR